MCTPRARGTVLRTVGRRSATLQIAAGGRLSPDDRCDAPVPPLVLGGHGCCLRGIQLAVQGSEALTADRNLGGVVCDEVGIPLRRVSESGEDDHLVNERGFRQRRRASSDAGAGLCGRYGSGAGIFDRRSGRADRRRVVSGRGEFSSALVRGRRGLTNAAWVGRRQAPLQRHSEGYERCRSERGVGGSAAPVVCLREWVRGLSVVRPGAVECPGGQLVSRGPGSPPPRCCRSASRCRQRAARAPASSGGSAARGPRSRAAAWLAFGSPWLGLRRRTPRPPRRP